MAKHGSKKKTGGRPAASDIFGVPNREAAGGELGRIGDSEGLQHGEKKALYFPISNTIFFDPLFFQANWVNWPTFPSGIKCWKRMSGTDQR